VLFPTAAGESFSVTRRKTVRTASVFFLSARTEPSWAGPTPFPGASKFQSAPFFFKELFTYLFDYCKFKFKFPEF
jgi:hypothetical protein